MTLTDTSALQLSVVQREISVHWRCCFSTKQIRFHLCFHPGPFRAPLRLLNRRQPWPIHWDGSLLVMLNGLNSWSWELRWSIAGYYPHCCKREEPGQPRLCLWGALGLWLNTNTTEVQTSASSAADVLVVGLTRRKIAGKSDWNVVFYFTSLLWNELGHVVFWMLVWHSTSYK